MHFRCTSKKARFTQTEKIFETTHLKKNKQTKVQEEDLVHKVYS